MLLNQCDWDSEGLHRDAASFFAPQSQAKVALTTQVICAAHIRDCGEVAAINHINGDRATPSPNDWSLKLTI